MREYHNSINVNPCCIIVLYKNHIIMTVIYASLGKKNVN